MSTVNNKETESKTPLVEVRAYDSMPCSAEIFLIRGERADEEDFGYSEDICNREFVEPYCCGCRKWFRDESLRKSAMSKYNLTYEEWDEVCDALEDELYVGECGWCV